MYSITFVEMSPAKKTVVDAEVWTARNTAVNMYPGHAINSEKPPYVCNNCSEKKLCSKDKYIYSAKHADATVTRRRSESRQGVRISDEKKSEMDELITKLVKKGQPLTHIYAEHENEIPVCLRTLYNYIDDGELTVKNIDLRRKTGYKKRGKGYQPPLGFANIEFRQGRTYTDFEYAMKVKYTEDEVVEMDTVKGVREQGKRLLTMIFRKNNVMLLFLMPDGKAESVKRVFDYLESGLGIEVFRRLFPVILTDNGSEFKKVDELELTTDEDGFLIYRTSLYYCDPMASWQKGCIEKNHEFIRYAIPKKKSLNSYNQDDITKLMNHINSVKRPGLGNKSPYELVEEDDEDFQELMRFLKMHLIPPDEVHLMPDLFVKK
ncbi:MAG: IS30 family transposase [[Ruminococcus] torques]